MLKEFLTRIPEVELDRSKRRGGLQLLLAPAIVEMIAAGAQAPELTAQLLLTDEKAVASSWRAQRQAFGLALPA